jgi:hypothetical protein
MKFFTKEWAAGDLSDEDFERVPSNYAQHVEALAIPPDVVDLDRTSLHDGILERILATDDSLVLSFITGDLQQGYFETSIRYQTRDAAAAARGLQALIEYQAVELIYAEVDRLDSHFVHRLLFASHEEVAIPFTSVLVGQSPRPDRAVRREPVA